MNAVVHEAPRAIRHHCGLSHRALSLSLSYIERRMGEPLTLEELARSASLSRFHFARKFRVSTGSSPMVFLLHARIERAKRMLAERRRAIVETALALGFCDQSHFTRSFKRLTGLTPREFSRQYAPVTGDRGTPRAPTSSLRAPLPSASGPIP